MRVALSAYYHDSYYHEVRAEEHAHKCCSSRSANICLLLQGATSGESKQGGAPSAETPEEDDVMDAPQIKRPPRRGAVSAEVFNEDDLANYEKVHML